MIYDFRVAMLQSCKKHILDVELICLSATEHLTTVTD